MMSKSAAKDLTARSMRHGYDHHGGERCGTVPCPLCKQAITGYAHPSETTAFRGLERTMFHHLFPLHLVGS
jgi:hypothetical protein